MTLKNNVAIYCRVSTKEQAEHGYSLEAQKKAGIKICNNQKLSYEVFTEAGASANKETLDNRPVLQKLLDDVELGIFNFVFVVEMDRLSRNPITLHFIKKILSENQCKVLTINQTYDFTDVEDDFLTDLLGAMAKRENRQRAARSMRGKVEAVKQGKWMGGLHPFGYDVIRSTNKAEKAKLVINKDEAKIYKQIVSWYIDESMGSRRIAYKLRELNFPTKNKSVYGIDTLWSENTILSMLRNKLYTGIYSFKGIAGKIPAIIDDETYERILLKMKQNKVKPDRITQHQYMLRGLMYCGNCGRIWYPKFREGGKYNYYICKSKYVGTRKYHIGDCYIPQIQARTIESFVWHELIKVLSTEDTVKTLISLSNRKNIVPKKAAFSSKVSGEIKFIDEQINRLFDLYAKTKTMSVAELDKKITELQQKKEKLQKQSKPGIVKDVPKINYIGIEKIVKQIKKQLSNLDYERQCQICKLLIQKVVVSFNTDKKKYNFDIQIKLPQTH